MDPVISAVDPNLVASISTLQEMLRQTDAFLIASFSAAIASIISLFGLLLASMGIYSTVSYVVVLRTREVGIRMAIGATKRDILPLMMRGSSRPVVAGLVAGMVLGAGASYLLRRVLYGLNIVDATTFGGACLLFLAIALVATWLPSRRATRVDPLVALRYERIKSTKVGIRLTQLFGVSGVNHCSTRYVAGVRPTLVMFSFSFTPKYTIEPGPATCVRPAMFTSTVPSLMITSSSCGWRCNAPVFSPGLRVVMCPCRRSRVPVGASNTSRRSPVRVLVRTRVFESMTPDRSGATAG